MSKPFIEAWQVTSQNLEHGKASEKMARKKYGPPQSFQHVVLEISRLSTDGIKISNPKITRKLCRKKGLTAQILHVYPTSPKLI